MRVLSLNREQIIELGRTLDTEIKQLKHQLLKLCWHMRGGVTMEEAWHMSHEDREIISNIVEENFEVTKKTNMPYF